MYLSNACAVCQQCSHLQKQMAHTVDMTFQDLNISERSDVHDKKCSLLVRLIVQIVLKLPIALLVS